MYNNIKIVIIYMFYGRKKRLKVLTRKYIDCYS